MSNQLLTISMITREALRVLVNNLVAADKVERQYDSYYGKTGAKIGNVINIRKPPRFVRTDGQGLQLQDVTETSVPLVLTTQAQRAFVFTSQDLELNIDDFSKRFVRPAAASLANQVDFDILQRYVDVYQFVGTPGTTPNALLTYLQAQQALNNSSAPDDDERYFIINPAAQATIVDALKGLFQSSAAISEQYKRGKMGTTAGAEWFMDQNVGVQTTGTALVGGSPTTLTTGNPQTGSSLSVVALTSGIINQGDIFTIASVYGVNPQNFQSTGQLQQFVATAATATGTSATVQISPAIITSGPFQTVTVAPATSAAITFYNTGASVSSPQNMLWHREAFALGTADLPLPTGVDMAERISDEELGLSIRLIRAYDINTDRFPLRLDFLYGTATLYPQLACRIGG